VGQLLTDVLVQNKVKFGGPFCARENGAWPSFADQNGQMVPPPEPDWNVEAEYYRRSLQNDDTQNYPNICLSAAVCFAWVTDESNLAKAMQGVVASMAEEWSNDAPTADEFADFMAQSSIFALPNDSRDATFWMTLADELERRWPDAAVVYYCRGSVAENTGDMVGAIDGFVSALEIDETFWAASWSCGAVYSQQRNYRTAAGYFRRALDEPGAQSKPDIWSQAAWCFLRTKDYAEAVDAYRRCLELAPDYRYATNDLGWSLIRAGKYEEAVEILSDAVERNIDGKYPIRNLAAALQKLGRYDEAIDTLRKDVTKTGGLSANAERRIAKLKELLAKPESERSSALETEADEEIELVEEPHVDDEETVEDDEVQQVAATRITASVIATARPKVAGASMPLERILEDLLEEKIRRGERVFGRGLMIYSSQDGRKYGRQFAIPGVGIIDVLAVDVETNELVVIELKRDQADRDVVGQTSHYKGWVAANLAGPGQSVVGIICVRDAAPSLRIAAAGAGLEVHHFNLSFDKL
jgi:tetratricopeptide (TPR) repeat protein